MPTRRPGFPPSFPGRPGGTSIPTPGTGVPFGGRVQLPANADTAEDFKAVAAGLESPDRGVRFAAIGVMRRSKHPGASAALAKEINGTERQMIISALGDLGPAGETELLKVIDPADTPDNLRPLLFALMRCGTDKSFKLLEQIQQHSDKSIAIMSQAAKNSIEVRMRNR